MLGDFLFFFFKSFSLKIYTLNLTREKVSNDAGLVKIGMVESKLLGFTKLNRRHLYNKYDVFITSYHLFSLVYNFWTTKYYDFSTGIRHAI